MLGSLRDRLRDKALTPLLALVLAGTAGYAGPTPPSDVLSLSAGTLPAGTARRDPGPGDTVVLAAPDRALEAVRIAVHGSAAAAAAAVLYDAYVAAVEAAPARCHLSASVLAALGQAEPGPLGNTESPRDLAAALAAAVDSLCAPGRDLARPADLRAALLARTGSPLIVRLVLTLKARYDLMGLGLMGAPGPVLVPLLLEQATALMANPYGPAGVYPSRAKKDGDGKRLPAPAADAREPTGASAPEVTRSAEEQAPAGSAAAAASVPVTPVDQSAADEDPSALAESASPDAAPGSASPSASTGSGDASGGPGPSVAPQDPGTDSVEPVCATGGAAEAPDAGAPSDTPSDSPSAEVVEPADPGAATAGPVACAAVPSPDTGSVTADPPVDASANATPEPTQETAPTVP